MTVGELIGVECGLCHEEAFRLFERKAYVTLKVCPRCARRIDAEELDRKDSEMLKGLTKLERKQAMKDRSHDWAHSWHGKHVVVTYNVDNGRGDIIKKNCHIKGTAYYASPHEDRWWGRVKVVLDDKELSRLYFKDFSEYPISSGTHHWLTVDGYEWGLGRRLIQRGYDEGDIQLPYAFYINWGDRQFFVLSEVNEQEELLAARREQERLDRERKKEIERHMGEGI